MDERNSGDSDKTDSESEDQQEHEPQPKPEPAPGKVGEPPGNLKKREDWFRKRSE